MTGKLAVRDRVLVCERRHGRRETYAPATVVDVARIYCRVWLDGAPRAMGQRFHSVTGYGEWPATKGGMCPYVLLRPAEYERIMAERAAAEAATTAAERAATDKLRALGLDLLPGRRARIDATALLATVERYGVTP